ncbi:replication-relaxation family protein (plasmid) [Embleya sp. NBC_00888]|uniref:replication-relaxation family protein n=1 Tax=Embleya sp. NBC_00888 TaxID=2975960 RepID=UPI002F90C267|nr:replication-relaxation family protein [Embleya sp. NBC_00888]
MTRSRIRDLAEQLTDRDRLVVRTLATHRVLTSHRIAELAFDSRSTARRRMKDLETMKAVLRFRPYAERGSNPFHFILASAGAAVMAVEDGEEPGPAARRALGDHRLVLLSGRRLARVLGVNAFRAALEAHARAHPDTAVEQWYGEGEIPHIDVPRGLDRPDAILIRREGPARSTFALEYDTEIEQPDRLARQAARYACVRPRCRDGETPLGRGVPIVLLGFASALRESNARAALTGSFGEVRIATGVWRAGTSPAGALWLPLDHRGPRTALAGLGEARRPATPGPTP